MKNQIKYFLILSLLIISSCASIKKVPISQESSLEIKDQTFTIVAKEEGLLNFSSHSFVTSFAIFIPYGIIWVPKMNGTKQAKKYDLKDPRPTFEKEISDTLVKKYKMKFEKTAVLTDSRDIKKLSDVYKDYPYVVDIGTAGVLLYIRFDDHGFNFATNFRLIDTKNKKELSNITCDYHTPQYYSKHYYFSNNAENLKSELTEAIGECIKILKSEI